MKKKGVIIGVIIAVIVIIAVSIIGSYNGLISLEESANTAYADIQVQLQRRMDLVPNLVNTVKGYAAHETEVFTAVSDARAKLAVREQLRRQVRQMKNFHRHLAD